MKSFPKILITTFLSIFIIQLFCLLFLLALPQTSQAAGVNFTPQVELPGYKFNSDDKSTGNIAEYIKAIYTYAIGIIGILAAVVLMVGGVLWIVAGGNATQVSEAKAWIGAALSGLVLALASYLILSTVNPALVDLKTSIISPVEDATKGSCTSPIDLDTGKTTCEDNSTKESCEGKGWNFNLGGKCATAKNSCCAYGTEGTGMDTITICGTRLDRYSTYSSCDDTSGLTSRACETKAGWFSGSQYLPDGECVKAPSSPYYICDCK